MTGFELQISSVRSDHSTKCATTTAHWSASLPLIKWLILDVWLVLVLGVITTRCNTIKVVTDNLAWNVIMQRDKTWIISLN